MTQSSNIVSDALIVGAGAAGLMAGRTLARAGKGVMILEARDRLGGRIHALPPDNFGYPAEGGAEFIHGEAPLTRTLAQQAGLATSSLGGERWHARNGSFGREQHSPIPNEKTFERALADLQTDQPIAQFLESRFAGAQHASLRSAVIRMVEGYDAADANRASTFAIRAEWMERGGAEQARIIDGYGALIAFLAAESRHGGTSIRTNAIVDSIDSAKGGIVSIRCRDGMIHEAKAVIVTVPLPLLPNIAFVRNQAPIAEAIAAIGFGNVIKILLRFRTRWWTGKTDADLAFLVSGDSVPTWWTQSPQTHPTLTGWIAGPRTEKFENLDSEALCALALSSLARTFSLPETQIRNELIASFACNWGHDPFARGAYSYATPETENAQTMLRQLALDRIYISGEAMYAGPNMGTVEAALASGLEAAESVIAAL